MIVRGDMREELRAFPDCHFHSVVTDCPYELDFQGHNWDRTGISYQPDTWRAVLRVLKPGGHLLSFAGARTYHRIASAIEDAGFEIRDMIPWHYSSGFPKSRDLSAVVDKAAGAERTTVVGTSRGKGYSSMQASNREAEYRPYEGGLPHEAADRTLYAPESPQAKAWGGWENGLKPATEPIVVARRPLQRLTSAQIGAATGWRYWHSRRRVLKAREAQKYASLGYSPGEGFEVETRRSLIAGQDTLYLLHHAGGVSEVGRSPYREWSTDSAVANMLVHGVGGYNVEGCSVGPRHPANALFAHSAGCARVGTKTARPYVINRWADGAKPFGGGAGHEYRGEGVSVGDVGVWRCEEGCPVRALEAWGACAEYFMCFEPPRFAYHKKANKAVPVVGKNPHPTPKDPALMAYLQRLVTPPGGRTLDPFCGCGSSGVGAVREGFEYVGIELEATFCDYAQRWIEHEKRTHV